MSDLVGNPEDRFSHVEAHLIKPIWWETPKTCFPMARLKLRFTIEKQLERQK